jgi:hypothetical protein
MPADWRCYVGMVSKFGLMSHQQKGTIHKIFNTEQVTDKFKKRLFVLSIESGPYTEYAPFEFAQDRVDMLDNYKEGDSVTVHFDIKGREWKGKFFCNLRAWKIEKVTEQPPVNNHDHNVETQNKGDGDNDGLPF